MSNGGTKRPVTPAADRCERWRGVRAALGLPAARAVARQGASGGVDNHDHIVLVGNRPGYCTPPENASSIADVQQTVAARAKAIPRGAWVTTIGGFHRNQLFPRGQNPRLPTLAELDMAAPDHPVYISESFMVPRPRTAWERGSSNARRRPYRSAKTVQSRPAPRAPAAPRWHYGRRS